ncbi:MAG: hypothetical protein ACQEW5_13415 [Bacillota bacterium]
MTDYTIGENSIKKYKLNVNQRRNEKIEWGSGVQPRFTSCKHLWLEDGLTEETSLHDQHIYLQFR